MENRVQLSRALNVVAYLVQDPEVSSNALIGVDQLRGL